MATKWVPSGTVNSYKIAFNDGAEPIEVRNNIGDVIAWERAHKTGFQDAVSAQSMLWVAWKAARRQNLTGEPTFDQFMLRVDELEIQVEEETSEDPTQTDQSEG